MFCPKCGSNQSENRKFCTHCGTNLHLVSQALTGQIPSPMYVPPPPNPLELERRIQIAKGYRYAIIGGGFVTYSLLDLISAGGFLPGPPAGVWGFVGFILMAIGISKIISYRTPLIAQPAESSIKMAKVQVVMPAQSVSSPNQTYDSPARGTNELEIQQHPLPSVIEDETLHLPKQTPVNKLQ